MARLSATLRPDTDSVAAMQLAVWAITNDPSRRALASHEADMVGEELEAEARQEAFETVLRDAAALLRRAELQPREFRMFRELNLPE